MPSGSAARNLFVLAGLGLLALLLAGAVMGVIGQKILGLGDGYVPRPEIHLPPQPVFPASVRDRHLGLTPAKDHVEEPQKDADHKEGTAAKEAQEGEAHSTPLPIMQFAVTNTLLSAWFATVMLVLFFVLGSRKKSLVPGRFQSLVETLIEAALNFCGSVLGPEMGRKAFPVVATIFFFVLFNAWLALLPFYQFLGFTKDGEIKAHLLRSAGTDLNFPLALALISFVFVEYWGIRSHGLGYFKKFFAIGGLLRLRPSGLIDAFVGFLELISEFVRIVSFTFRLFGNMTAGEILVVMITFLVPFVAVEFVFGLELLVGLIQAVIFASLTLVFLSVAVSHQEH
ncbi:MAG: F0F1 ATP synthase subunit A [Dehalococcoidia bacterium]|nr:F0F1 ATP synthase subunit A [Dehalococcoidia bacterium]